MSGPDVRRVIAVVVTFNRIGLLQSLLERLDEVPELTEILVIDNASTDGTGEWLAGLDDRETGDDRPTTAVLGRTLADNIGGAGGFHDGLAWAMERGADLAWLMDDDGLPDPGCLARLLEERDLDFWGPLVVDEADPVGWSSRSGSPAAPGSCTSSPTSSEPRPAAGSRAS